jgi:DNA polymerase alpha subunit A
VLPRESISGLEKKSTNSDFLPSLRATLHVRMIVYVENILLAYLQHYSLSITYLLLQELASGLKSEIADKLSDLNVSNFVMTPVKVSRCTRTQHRLFHFPLF